MAAVLSTVVLLIIKGSVPVKDIPANVGLSVVPKSCGSGIVFSTRSLSLTADVGHQYSTIDPDIKTPTVLPGLTDVGMFNLAVAKSGQASASPP